MKPILNSLLICTLLAMAHAAWAVPIAYNFNTTGKLSGPILTGPVSGSFTYDSETPFTMIANPNPPTAINGSSLFNDAVSALNGSVDGNSFAGTSGPVFVANDEFAAGLDMIILNGGNLQSTFSLNGFTLVSVRLFWLEGLDGITDYISGNMGDNQFLPGILPPTSGGRMGLDFIDATGAPATALFTVAVTRVSAPSTVLLMILGMAGLGVFARKIPGEALTAS